MIGGGGCRISQHIRECNHLHNHHQYQTLGLGLGLSNGRYIQFSSLMMKPPPTFLVAAIIGPCRNFNRRRMVFSSSLDSKSPGVFSDSISQPEGDLELPSQGLSPVAGGIVALGKFDALHVGHRELAIQASKIGTPYLLSFVGMAEVLGWEPRTPIVAKCDRKRILSSWASFCGNVTPSEFQIKFASVRHLTPRQFVEKLSNDLGVRGVVAGENYRFGYKAAGDASELMRLCDEYGIEACIISSVMDKYPNPVIASSGNLKDRGQVSSTRVRSALARGDITYVSQLLGRQHRLIVRLKDGDMIHSCSSGSKISLSVPKSCVLNLPPKEGLYEKCSLLYADEKSEACEVLIDFEKLYLELDESGPYNFDEFQDLKLMGIEFGD